MKNSSRCAIVATARWIIVIVRCGNCFHKKSGLGKPVTYTRGRMEEEVRQIDAYSEPETAGLLNHNQLKYGIL
jgi:hypothetical protein